MCPDLQQEAPHKVVKLDPGGEPPPVSTGAGSSHDATWFCDKLSCRRCCIFQISLGMTLNELFVRSLKASTIQVSARIQASKPCTTLSCTYSTSIRDDSNCTGSVWMELSGRLLSPTESQARTPQVRFYRHQLTIPAD